MRHSCGIAHRQRNATKDTQRTGKAKRVYLFAEKQKRQGHGENWHQVRHQTCAIGADLRYAAISHQIQKYVEVEALDAESLLVEWLSELAYWAETEMLIFTRFDLQKVTPTKVEANLFGEKVQKLEKHIKAVTYHNLRIAKTDRGLEVTIVFDV